MDILKETPQGITLAIRVVPRAARGEVVVGEGKEVKVRVMAPPLEGRANAEVIALIAHHLQIPRHQVAVVTGEHSRLKTIMVKGVTIAHVKARLGIDDG